ncbi:hypothetical protein ZWY2020_011474 [Hordeum vulgare]|nr:hypothetical protein ZWY2020_011474 [Hordeum vulgare]
MEAAASFLHVRIKQQQGEQAGGAAVNRRLFLVACLGDAAQDLQRKDVDEEDMAPEQGVDAGAADVWRDGGKSLRWMPSSLGIHVRAGRTSVSTRACIQGLDIADVDPNNHCYCSRIEPYALRVLRARACRH